jgi:hypothetical protein
MGRSPCPQSEYNSRMKPTKVRIDAKFATAEEAAEILGVPTSRMKDLVRLMRSGSNGKLSKDQALALDTQKRRNGRTAVGRKGHARGKVAKASR